MSKILRCRDVGMDCDFVVRGETEAEIMQKAAEHAQTTHDLKEILEAVAAQVRAAIRDESPLEFGSRGDCQLHIRWQTKSEYATLSRL